MAGLAAVTEKIRIYATCPTLVIPPAFCARMCNTIDSISHGRFGLNLITGWQRPEYSQMGLWPGDEHFRNRYQMLGEYAHILRELWATGVSELQGRILPDGGLPGPAAARGRDEDHLRRQARTRASLSRRNMRITPSASARASTRPTAFASNNERLMAATAKTGRDVRIYALFMVIAAETDEEAMEKWISYREGVDEEAVAWLGAQGAADKTSTTTNVRQLADQESAVNLNMGTLVGSYESIARMLDEATHRAEHRRRAAHLRRFHRGDGEVRDPDPAADEVPGGGDGLMPPMRRQSGRRLPDRALQQRLVRDRRDHRERRRLRRGGR